MGNLFYNILVVRVEHKNNRLESPFAGHRFSFTSICLDGTLTPSKRNALFLLVVAEESAAPTAVAVWCSIAVPERRGVLYTLSGCQLMCFGVCLSGLLSSLRST